MFRDVVCGPAYFPMGQTPTQAPPPVENLPAAHKAPVHHFSLVMKKWSTCPVLLVSMSHHSTYRNYFGFDRVARPLAIQGGLRTRQSNCSCQALLGLHSAQRGSLCTTNPQGCRGRFRQDICCTNRLLVPTPGLTRLYCTVPYNLDCFCWCCKNTLQNDAGGERTGRVSRRDREVQCPPEYNDVPPRKAPCRTVGAGILVGRVPAHQAVPVLVHGARCRRRVCIAIDLGCALNLGHIPCVVPNRSSGVAMYNCVHHTQISPTVLICNRLSFGKTVVYFDCPTLLCVRSISRSAKVSSGTLPFV